jgi:hypothetical protein
LVSISEADRANGSPKAGDMIARNPVNHDDQWLIASEYFAKNFSQAAPKIVAMAHGGNGVLYVAFDDNALWATVDGKWSTIGCPEEWSTAAK